MPAGLQALCISLLVLIWGTQGCGYAMRTSKDPSGLARQGVSRIYVRPVQNLTYRPGVENAVYSQLVRMLSSTPGLRPVNRPEDADAELVSSVVTANRGVSGEIKASDLNPKNVGSSQLLVASEYTASLACAFSIQKGKQVLWKSDFARSRPFPANTQVGALGSTGPLLNESEFARALEDAASDMMIDVRSSLSQDF